MANEVSVDETHAERVKRELAEAGAKGHGSIKLVENYLPKLIHDNEHIRAVVHGRYRQPFSVMSLSTGMLVATDQRVIFLDHKPGYTTWDELSYDIVSGVKKTSAGLYTTVTLHTRVSDYTITYANPKCIDQFVKYIEDRRFESKIPDTSITAHIISTDDTSKLPDIGANARTFLKTHDTGVLSTIGRTGEVHGSVVHYLLDEKNYIYILISSSTQKARDLFVHHQVYLTVYDVDVLQTVQLSGIAVIESDQQRANEIIAILSQPRVYDGKLQMPPVTKLKEDKYLVVKITTADARFKDFIYK